MSDIKDIIKESRNQEIKESLQKCISDINREGYKVEFGKIGVHTTYALLTNTSNIDEEIVGYTFIRNMKYYNEDLGKLKSLQQAIARREVIEK